MLWILSLSLKPTSTVKDGKLIPAKITLDNYKGIFQGDIFTSALINSLGIGLITTVIAVVVGGMAAYAVARLAFSGKRLLVGVALLIAMFPQISLVTPIFNIGGGSVSSTLARPDHSVHHIRAAAGHLHVVGVFFREIPWDLEGRQDGRHARSGPSGK